jgi:hypothetical protein
MKKVIASVLSLMLVLALSVSVFANGGFVKSPTLDKAPTVEDVTVETGTAPTVTVTPYDDRHDLTTADKADLEVAYNEIKAAADLTKVAADLTKVAADKKVEAKNLAVSDLFDISHDGAAGTNFGTFTIKLSADEIKNFVALLHKGANGWTVVESAKIEGDHLVFSVEDFSPFAIVVDAGAGSPSTGDNANLPLYIALMAVSAVALVVVIVALKKKKSN